MKSIRINRRETAALLTEKDYITILCHASPDGDTLGSAYALCGTLQKLGKNARVLCPDEISPRFEYLKNAVTDASFGNDKERFIVSVDVADEVLLGDLEETYKGRINLAIDHHCSNMHYADKLLLENAAANAEIIYAVIKELGVLMDEHIAACLYTGIATDTGCFRFSNTTPSTHLVAAEIMEHGFDSAGLNYLLFDMKSKHRLELEKKALEEMEYYLDGACSIISLNEETLRDADCEDINGISALARQIEGVELGMTFKEKEKDVWKVSLRSNSYINCQEICRVFGGGGHIRAAGCKLSGTFEECRDKLVEEARKHIKV